MNEAFVLNYGIFSLQTTIFQLAKSIVFCRN